MTVSVAVAMSSAGFIVKVTIADIALTLARQSGGAACTPFSQSPLLVIFERIAESGDPLFEIVGQQRRADQVRGLVAIVDLARLGQSVRPFAAIEIAAAEPHQREDLYLLLVVERIECRGELLPGGVVDGGFEDRHALVVAWV